MFLNALFKHHYQADQQDLTPHRSLLPPPPRPDPALESLSIVDFRWLIWIFTAFTPKIHFLMSRLKYWYYNDNMNLVSTENGWMDGFMTLIHTEWMERDEWTDGWMDKDIWTCMYTEREKERESSRHTTSKWRHFNVVCPLREREAHVFSLWETEDKQRSTLYMPNFTLK